MRQRGRVAGRGLAADFSGLDKGEVFLEGGFAAHLLAGRNAKAALLLPGQAFRFRAEFGWKPFEGHGLLLPRRRAADEAQMEPGGMASGPALTGRVIVKTRMFWMKESLSGRLKAGLLLSASRSCRQASSFLTSTR